MGALDNLDSNLSGDQGGAGSYINQVYLGRQEFPGVKGTLRGKKVDTGKIYSDKTLTIQQAKALYLTDENLRNSWLQTLKKNGLPTDPLKARAVWDIAVDGASDWYATSNGTQKITPEKYLSWYVGGQKKVPKPDLSRSVYQYAPEQIDADINEVAQKVLGREIVDTDKQAEWYQDLTKGLNKMIAGGITTQSKLVKNKKTGKLEQVTTQTPEFTKEKAVSTIETAISEADPVSLERKKNLDFANWAFEKMGGRG
jgi:hypothetical protein